MRLVHCSCSGLRRVCAPARTGSNQQHSHFRRNIIAPVDIMLRRGSAGCARHVAISRRKQDVNDKSNVSSPIADFQLVEYLPVSSARRNQWQAAQPMHIVDELPRRRRFIVENCSIGKHSGRIV